MHGPAPVPAEMPRRRPGRDEEVDRRREVAPRGVEAGPLVGFVVGQETERPLRCGRRRREGVRDGGGVTVRFGKVAALDVRDEVEGGNEGSDSGWFAGGRRGPEGWG